MVKQFVADILYHVVFMKIPLIQPKSNYITKRKILKRSNRKTERNMMPWINALRKRKTM